MSEWMHCGSTPYLVCIYLGWRPLQQVYLGPVSLVMGGFTTLGNGQIGLGGFK